MDYELLNNLEILKDVRQNDVIIFHLDADKIKYQQAHDIVSCLKDIVDNPIIALPKGMDLADTVSISSAINLLKNMITDLEQQNRELYNEH